ncbi:Ku protein [Caulobacter sp. 17J80-11]|uniref:non-homologous end joining protein Ku n=1 Tax=Caulobacter sp. 17J80-11 TaxID=2763502 RepID=UPI0016535628|nr:Ku protein [Caulobacter sp. 17J80-11]MBC6980885.1 Ku protein [Caulobacter sp. 17J80-11]
MPAARPTWQGHLRLSLVTCPVALYPATSRTADISFHLINPQTNNRIRMITTDPDTGPIERSSLVKGYEFEKNQYVLFTPDEIDAVKIESTKVIDIERFVDLADIDRLYWNDPYFLVPDGKMAAEAYAVIREAMSKSERVALGRVVLHSRERLVALEPRDRGLVAYTLRSHDEVRSAADFFRDIPDAQPPAAMVEIASKIIEQLEGPFEPEMFRDRYEDALRDLIQSKLKGKAKTITAAEPEDTEVDDLMEMLKQSLQRSSSTARRPAAAKPKAKAPPPKRKPPSEPARRASGGTRRR